MRMCSLVIFAFCLYQFLDFLVFRESLRCSFASWFSSFLKAFTGSWKEPSDSDRKRFTPRSPPTLEAFGWIGSATSFSVWIETNQCAPLRATVTFRGVPSMGRLLKKATQPILGRQTRFPSSLKP